MALNLAGVEPTITDSTVFTHVTESFDASKRSQASLGAVCEYHPKLAEYYAQIAGAGDPLMQSALVRYETDPDTLVFALVPSMAMAMLFDLIRAGQFAGVYLEDDDGGRDCWPLVRIFSQMKRKPLVSAHDDAIEGR